MSLQGLILHQITTDANSELERILELEEIREAVFTMGTYKSPELDGMTTTFLQDLLEHRGTSCS